eukprot:804291-Pleurochrysis_carterae.AAC.2
MTKKYAEASLADYLVGPEAQAGQHAKLLAPPRSGPATVGIRECRVAAVPSDCRWQGCSRQYHPTRHSPRADDLNGNSCSASAQPEPAQSCCFPVQAVGCMAPSGLAYFQDPVGAGAPSAKSAPLKRMPTTSSAPLQPEALSLTRSLSGGHRAPPVSAPLSLCSAMLLPIRLDCAAIRQAAGRHATFVDFAATRRDRVQDRYV